MDIPNYFTPELIERARRITTLVLDVDGVLTDGGIYYADRYIPGKSDAAVSKKPAGAQTLTALALVSLSVVRCGDLQQPVVRLFPI